MIHETLYILGAGGHGKVAADCARSSGQWKEVLFLDDRWPQLISCESWRVVGSSQILMDRSNPTDNRFMNCEFFVAIGHAEPRLMWLHRLKQKQLKIASIKHTAAIVSSDASYDPGAIFVAGAIVNIGVRMGMGCIVNTGATVDHDCTLGEGVHVCPGANLGGGVTVGDGSWIGIGSSVRHGVRIGSGVTIGAGAAVVADVSDGLTMVGVPARPKRSRSPP